jgi:hypothetical protein
MSNKFHKSTRTAIPIVMTVNNPTILTLIVDPSETPDITSQNHHSLENSLINNENNIITRQMCLS